MVEMEAGAENPNYIMVPPPPPPSVEPQPQKRPIFSFPRRPSLRITSEFDSESAFFFHKISCKLLDSLAKFKFSFHNNSKGDVSEPQFSFVSKHLSLHYDLEDHNALVKTSIDVGPRLQLSAAHDVKVIPLHLPPPLSIYLFVCLFILHILTSVRFPLLRLNKERLPWLQMSLTLAMHLNYQHQFHLLEWFVLPCFYRIFETNKIETEHTNILVSLILFFFEIYLQPKATFRFPVGEVSLQEKEEEEEVKNLLSVSGILKGQFFNGVCAAQYKDEELKLRYCYKDDEMSFLPILSLPSNALSFAFKRRFGPSDKLSYWYNCDSNYWSAVYKRTYGKDFKFKAGYDSEVRLGWASLWVGDEGGKAKTAPMKMKVQFMLQVPQDDIKSSVLMFRIKKRWDI
ncbi:outer envelope pore protein 37, chloroplastic isoform X1 [Abrus precatorius]|uniref:Outer envelope pore protein 37, chloroplastic isoform X1 n=1 Tax=Abrus precatorius TaxID=3816 RepID=A0A8B8JFQ5_ABRPR|nr:outer envelope pore protein 37, chloroplastic isoform X1 [Abrus precatorius]